MEFPTKNPNFGLGYLIRKSINWIITMCSVGPQPPGRRHVSVDKQEWTEDFAGYSPRKVALYKATHAKSKQARTFKLASCCGSVFEARGDENTADVLEHGKMDEEGKPNVQLLSDALGKRRFSSIKAFSEAIDAFEGDIGVPLKKLSLDKSHKLTQLEIKVDVLSFQMAFNKADADLKIEKLTARVSELEDIKAKLENKIIEMERIHSSIQAQRIETIRRLEKDKNELQETVDHYEKQIHGIGSNANASGT